MLFQNKMTYSWKWYSPVLSTINLNPVPLHEELLMINYEISFHCYSLALLFDLSSIALLYFGNIKQLLTKRECFNWWIKTSPAERFKSTHLAFQFCTPSMDRLDTPLTKSQPSSPIITQHNIPRRGCRRSSLWRAQSFYRQQAPRFTWEWDTRHTL